MKVNWNSVVDNMEAEQTEELYRRRSALAVVLWVTLLLPLNVVLFSEIKLSFEPSATDLERTDEAAAVDTDSRSVLGTERERGDADVTASAILKFDSTAWCGC